MGISSKVHHLMRAAGVLDVHMVTRQDLDQKPRRVVYVVPGESRPVELAHVARHLRNMDVETVFVDRFPLRVDGQVDQDALFRLPVLIEQPGIRVEKPAVGVGIDAAPVNQSGTQGFAIAPAPPVDISRDRVPAHLSGPALIASDLELRLADILVRAASDAQPAALSFVRESGDETSYTLHDLLISAQRSAVTIADSSPPHMPVVLQCGVGFDFLAGFWGAILAGRPVVPLLPTSADPSSPAETRLAVLAEKLEHSLILAESGPLSTGNQIVETWLDKGYGPVAYVDDHLAPDQRAIGRIHGGDAQVLIPTSGSTGAPKLVCLSDTNIISMCAAHAQHHELGREDVDLNWLPLDHVGGLLFSHVRNVYLNADQTHIATSYISADLLRWLEHLSRKRASITWAPNFAYSTLRDRLQEAAIAESSRLEKLDLSRLRYMFNGGEAVVSRIARAVERGLLPYGAQSGVIQPAWGMSECASVALFSDKLTHNLDVGSHLAPAGSPLPGVEVRVVNDEDVTCGQSEIGNLQIRSPTVMGGYFPISSAENALTHDGWLRTGDLAAIADGQVVIVGRNKDVVVTRGKKIPCEELEDHLRRVYVDRGTVAVVPVGQERGEESFGVVLSLDTGSAASAERVAAVLGRDYGIKPIAVIRLEEDAFPRTDIGKLKRSELSPHFDAYRMGPANGGLTGETHSQLYEPVWVQRRAGRQLSAGDLLVVSDAGTAPATKLIDALKLQAPCPVSASSLEGVASVQSTIGSVLILDGLEPGTSDLIDSAQVASRVAVLSSALERVAQTAARQEIVVISTSVHGLPDSDIHASARAVAVRNAAMEWPEHRWRHVFVPHAHYSDHHGLAELVVEELSCHPGGYEIAYPRPSVRLIRRLRPYRFAPAQTSRPAKGGLAVVAGGFGGVGRELVEHLLGLGFSVAVFGRTPAESLPPSCIAWARERGVRYWAADISSTGAVLEALDSAEADFGGTATIFFQLAGTESTGRSASLSQAELQVSLSPKLDSVRSLAAALTDRPGLRTIFFSSATAHFGTPSFGAYAIANRSMEAACKTAIPGSVSIAWSGWAATGMSARHDSSDASFVRGYTLLEPQRALGILDFLIDQVPPPGGRVVVASLDDRRPSVARESIGAVELLEAAEISEGLRLDDLTDPFGVSLRRVRSRRRSSSSHEPLSGIELELGHFWAELLGMGLPSAEDNFFELGGDSILAARLHHRIAERFDESLSLRSVLSAISLADLARAIREHMGPSAEVQSSDERRL
jgi:nonribosomal peptide synthetase DhbF